MTFQLKSDGRWYKNAAGLYVQMEPIDRALVAAASEGDVVSVAADGTLELTTPATGGSGSGGGGTLVLLDAQTVSSAVASVNMTTGISDTYDEYELRFALVPVNDNVGLRARLSSNAGSSWDSGASDYRYTYGRQRDGSASAFDVINRSAGQTYIEMAANIGSDTGEGIAGVIRLPSMRSTTLRKMLTWDLVNMSDVAEVAWQHGSGARISASQFDGIQLFFSSGNVESGWARLYGVSKTAGSGGGSTYYPDQKPASPDANDDEFDDTSGMSGSANGLNARWTQINWSTTSVAWTPEGIQIAPPAAGANSARVLALTDAGSTWTYRVKVSATQPRQAYNHVGVCVLSAISSSAKIVDAAFEDVGSGAHLLLSRWTSPTGFNGNGASWNAVDYPAPGAWLYWEIENTGTAVVFRYSANGLAYTEFATETIASFLGSVAGVGLLLNANSGGSAPVGCYKFIRKVA